MVYKGSLLHYSDTLITFLRRVSNKHNNYLTAVEVICIAVCFSVIFLRVEDVSVSVMVLMSVFVV